MTHADCRHDRVTPCGDCEGCDQPCHQRSAAVRNLTADYSGVNPVRIADLAAHIGTARARDVLGLGWRPA